MIWILVLKIIAHSLHTTDTIQVLSFPTKSSCEKAELSLQRDDYIIIVDACYSSKEAMKHQNEKAVRE